MSFATHLMTSFGGQSPIDAARQDVVVDALRRRDFDALEEICIDPETPADTLAALCAFDECRLWIGHRRDLPPFILLLLAEVYRYPEAVLTLGKRFYTDPEVPAEQFSEFLTRHADDGWLLDSLPRLKSSHPAKSERLIEALRQHPDSVNLLATYQSYETAFAAGQENDPDVLRAMVDREDHRVWLALAKNSNTPRDVLERLATVKNHNNARSIRNLALERLRDQQ